ncbi:MAG: hypothetical protein PHG97_01410 [Candidatus Margulisbacteria bacterium]|nr:hypothetical protein [Candidatus Margulisiibacteriota bacterium]
MLFATVVCLPADRAFAQTELRPLMPAYWVVGNISDIPEAQVGTREVYFFPGASKLDRTALDAGNYAVSRAVPGGGGSQYMLNAFTIFPLALEVGKAYIVATAQDEKGYGADGTVTITGFGWNRADLSMSLGGGIRSPILKGAEPPPNIRVWFNNRLYQPALVAKGEKFIISPKPEVRIEATIDSPYVLARDINAYSMSIDAKPKDLSASTISRVFAAGTVAESAMISAMNIKYNVVDALAEGEHIFSFSSSSSGLRGAASTSVMLATVEVLGGPLRLIGPPLTFPSPYSISKNRIVTIQYQLSANANIDIYLIGVSGQRVKKFSFNSGQEGGSAGINKVTWDGMTDQGSLAGNAIYVGTILGRDENKLLGKVKLTIVD